MDGRKCKGRLVFMFMCQRFLYIRPSRVVRYRCMRRSELGPYRTVFESIFIPKHTLQGILQYELHTYIYVICYYCILLGHLLAGGVYSVYQVYLFGPACARDRPAGKLLWEFLCEYSLGMKTYRGVGVDCQPILSKLLGHAVKHVSTS